MPDREKVIEALKMCVLKDPDDSRDCRHCPRCNYGAFITTSCINGVMADALALLKAQEPMMVKHTTSTIRCPKCNKQITSRGAIHDEIKFCWKCGQAVKWE